MSLHNTDAQEVGVHVIAPAAALEADPLQHAVAAFPLSEAAAAVRAGGVRLPEGAGRFAVSVDGTEPEEDVAALRVCFLLPISISAISLKLVIFSILASWGPGSGCGRYIN